MGASGPEPGPAEVVLLTVPLDELEVTECCPEALTGELGVAVCEE